MLELSQGNNVARATITLAVPTQLQQKPVSLPDLLQAIPVGSALSGALVGRDPKHGFILRTAKGDLFLNAELDLKPGSKLELVVEEAGNTLRARIVSINGRPPEQHKQQPQAAPGFDEQPFINSIGDALQESAQNLNYGDSLKKLILARMGEEDLAELRHSPLLEKIAKAIFTADKSSATAEMIRKLPPAVQKIILNLQSNTELNIKISPVFDLPQAKVTASLPEGILPDIAASYSHEAPQSANNIKSVLPPNVAIADKNTPSDTRPLATTTNIETAPDDSALTKPVVVKEQVQQLKTVPDKITPTIPQVQNVEAGKVQLPGAVQPAIQKPEVITNTVNMMREYESTPTQSQIMDDMPEDSSSTDVRLDKPVAINNASSSKPVNITNVSAEAEIPHLNSDSYKKTANNTALITDDALDARQPLPVTRQAVPVAMMYADNTDAITIANQNLRIDGILQPLKEAGQNLVKTILGNFSFMGEIEQTQAQRVSVEIALEQLTSSASEDDSTAIESDIATLLKSAGSAGHSPLAGLFANIIPQANAKMASGMVFILSLLTGRSTSSFFSDDTYDEIERHGQTELLKKSLTEITRPTQLINDRTDNSPWQQYSIPVFDGFKMNEMKLLVQQDNQGNASTDNNDDNEQRFIFLLNLSHLGDMQLDGRINKNNHINVIIRSHAPLEERLKAEIYTLYTNALELTGYKGAVTFQNGLNQLLYKY